MAPLEIVVFCSASEAEMNALRLRLRQAMKAEGLLPHWKERYPAPQTGSGKNKAFEPRLEMNGKTVWKFVKPGVQVLSTEELQSYIRRYQSPGLPLKRVVRTHLSFLAALFIAFFPKCPFCWAAYMSLLSGFGVGSLPYQPWLLPFFIGLLFLNIGSLYLSRKRHGYKPLLLALAGAIVISVNRLFWEQKEWLVVGVALLIVASLWNSLPRRMVYSLRQYVQRFH